MRVTDRQTDGQTDRITTPKTALAYARAVKTNFITSRTADIIKTTALEVVKLIYAVLYVTQRWVLRSYINSSFYMRSYDPFFENNFGEPEPIGTIFYTETSAQVARFPANFWRLPPNGRKWR